MKEETPEEAMARRITSLESTIQTLQSETRLSSPRDALEDMDTRVNGLLPTFEDLRKRGYVFGKGFDAQAEDLKRQWQAVRPRVLQEIDSQAPQLEQALRPLEASYAQVRARSGNLMAVENTVNQLESTLEALKDRVDAVESCVDGMYDSLEKEVNDFRSKLERIDEMLKLFGGATFRLMPNEGAIAAVKAVFSRDEKMGNEDPEGTLFLTEQRIIFEQNQDIATKKILFITTEKQKVQKVLMETPVALIDQVQATKKGMFGHEDHLALTFLSGASYYQAWFHITGQDSNEWQVMLGRARSGDFKNERAVAIDEKEVEKVKAAPAQCPNCGAPVTQVILRGMDSLTCAYCQHVIRL